ncbi:hypothetical protein [Mesorhizobium marinum]|uniref:DUF2933 domain-containing protein n=1 Tax=Mesorhizobium marinum TaxID=3228790 RepID=A0ABV3QWL4_9HYPH
MASLFSKKWLYRVASALILGGFALLCQPFTHALFVIGFPILLAGVALFMILDHVPDGRIEEDNNA